MSSNYIIKIAVIDEMKGLFTFNKVYSTYISAIYHYYKLKKNMHPDSIWLIRRGIKGDKVLKEYER